MQYHIVDQEFVPLADECDPVQRVKFSAWTGAPRVWGVSKAILSPYQESHTGSSSYDWARCSYRLVPMDERSFKFIFSLSWQDGYSEVLSPDERSTRLVGGDVQRDDVYEATLVVAEADLPLYLPLLAAKRAEDERQAQAVAEARRAYLEQYPWNEPWEAILEARLSNQRIILADGTEFRCSIHYINVYLLEVDGEKWEVAALWASYGGNIVDRDLGLVRRYDPARILLWQETEAKYYETAKKRGKCLYSYEATGAHRLFPELFENSLQIA